MGPVPETVSKCSLKSRLGTHRVAEARSRPPELPSGHSHHQPAPRQRAAWGANGSAHRPPVAWGTAAGVSLPFEPHGPSLRVCAEPASVLASLPCSLPSPAHARGSNCSARSSLCCAHGYGDRERDHEDCLVRPLLPTTAISASRPQVLHLWPPGWGMQVTPASPPSWSAVAVWVPSWGACHGPALPF